MKRFIRAIIFYSLALYITSLIIPGFKLVTDWRGLLISGLTLALLFTLVNPIFKLLLLPVNIITLGLFSFVSQILTFYVFLWIFPDWIHITAWKFAGWKFAALGLSFAPFWVNSFFTVVTSTFVISFIVSVLFILL